MPTAGEFSRRSQNDVDISDFEHIAAASSDDETLIIDPDILDILADLPPKKPVDWTSSWVSSHICSQRESLAEQYGDVTLVQWQRNIFILDFRFLSISINVVVLCVVIIIYLYLFSWKNDSCMASPFIQLSKNTYFYWVICYYYAVIRNSSCQGTKKLNPWKMAVPGANFAGKRVGSKGLIYVGIRFLCAQKFLKILVYTLDFSLLFHVLLLIWTLFSFHLVENSGSSSVQHRTHNWRPAFESPLPPFRSLGIFVLSTMPQLIQLYKLWVPGYRQWLKCDWIVFTCCVARMLPREAELVPEWTGLPRGAV